MSENPDTPLARIPFTERDEASILALSKWMQLAGIIGMVGSIARAVAAFTPRHDVGQLVGAVLSFLVGLWTYQAAQAFGQVARTDVADQRFLVQGFALVRRVFLLQAVLVFVALAMLVVVLLGLAVFMIARP